MTRLLVAAGGGGDALGALMIRRLLEPNHTNRALVATLAWERLRLDPNPGPRGTEGFAKLGLLNGLRLEILARSDTRPPGRSTLPRLAAESGARVFLLDPAEGVYGLTRQLHHLIDALSIDEVTVVDVGGDAIAEGSEPHLRSPLADALVVAAGVTTDATLAIAGPGLDGELSEAEVLNRLAELGGANIGSVRSDDVEPFRGVLSWHPTESTALLAAAADGLRGRVDLRRGDTPVPLSDRSSMVWRIPARTIRQMPLVRLVAPSRTLEEASARLRTVTTSELDYERAKANRLATAHRFGRQDWIIALAGYLDSAVASGCTHATARRLLEATGVPVEESGQVMQSLGAVVGGREGALWDLDSLRNYVRRVLYRS